MKDKWNSISLESRFIFIIFIVYATSIIIGHPIGCLIYAITGIECPGCGMTSAWYWFLKGDISKAFYYHPLFLLPLFVAILYLINSKVVKIKKFNQIIVACAILMIGVYVVRIIFNFEMFVPLDTEFNLFNIVK